MQALPSCSAKRAVELLEARPPRGRLGTSVSLGCASWLVRPALRAGMEHDGHEVSPTVGASLTFGRRYGARFILRGDAERADQAGRGRLMQHEAGASNQ